MLTRTVQELHRMQAAQSAGVGGVARQLHEIQELLSSDPAEKSGSTGEKIRFIGAVGAGPKPFLRILSAHYEFALELEHRVNRGKTTAHLTGLLLRWLPWIALAMTQFLGLPGLSFLIYRPEGWVLLAAASALSVAAGLLSKRLISKAKLTPEDPGLWLLLVAGALRQGMGVNRCVSVLRNSAGRLPQVEREIVEAMSRGGPLAAYLEAKAAGLRTDLRNGKELEVEKLPIRLLLPLGGLLIPQFMLLLVVPMVMSALTAV